MTGVDRNRTVPPSRPSPRAELLRIVACAARDWALAVSGGCGIVAAILALDAIRYTVTLSDAMALGALVLGGMSIGIALVARIGWED